MVPLREVEKSRGRTAFGKVIPVLDIIEFKLLMIHLGRNMECQDEEGKTGGLGVQRNE